MREIAVSKDIPLQFIAEIEKLSNLGLGITRVDGYVVFVENACPGDKLRLKVTKKNKNYAYAVIDEIIEPSIHRCKPVCPMQKICGACQLQFIDYNFQLEQKREIVRDAMRGLEVEVRAVIPSPKIAGYRRKIQYPVSETKNSKRILAGYYKSDSHEIVNIKYCPIQPSSCDKIIDFIRNTASKVGVSGYNESSHSGDLRHVVIRSSEYSDKNLVILVVNSDKIYEKYKDFAHKIYSELEDIAGVGINLNPNKTNLILGKETKIIEGEGYIEERLCGKIFKVGADTFFQVNPSSAENIFNYVKKYISENFKNPIIMDAYAGISAFGICLSDVAKQVVCVEEVTSSVELAKEVIKENKIENVELNNLDAGEFFEKELNTKGKYFDITVLDPPRKGCSQQSLDYALKLTKEKIIYVSCNPSTLARDLKYLSSKGCTVEYIQPFDMFPHTYHIENVAIVNVK